MATMRYGRGHSVEHDSTKSRQPERIHRLVSARNQFKLSWAAVNRTAWGGDDQPLTLKINKMHMWTGILVVSNQDHVSHYVGAV